ncbi:MAG: hypothetical protein WBA10_18345 [Elainellaceae cyanobacterium]
MTFLYPERPSTEAASILLPTDGAPILERQTSQERSPQPPNPNGEIIRHILIGSPEGIREAIHLLHLKRYVEQSLWTQLIKIGDDGVKITHKEGQVLSYLTRQRSLDVPLG